MHKCEPPTGVLDEWLKPYPTVNGTYGHLLLEQGSSVDDKLISSLRPYFESAHLDAREHFHRQIAIDLHPDAGMLGEQTCYPNCLPSTAHRGLFGEVMAGMLTEAYKENFVGQHEWKIPIFLFRMHADVEKYLWDLARDPSREREIFGRFGSDFIGISLSDTGEVTRIIVGEAKWRKRLTPSVAETLMLGNWKEDEETGERIRSRGVWFEINRDTPVPHGLRQLQRILEDRAPDEYKAAIVSIDRAVALQDAPKLPRTNLILIAGNGAISRKPGDVLIHWEETPSEYTAPHDLQVVELILNDGDTLVDGIYASLWKE
jgi:hypothetical protein